jgi:aryl-alcohol dehydrogenase-like predicted oxidoreductase
MGCRILGAGKVEGFGISVNTWALANAGHIGFAAPLFRTGWFATCSSRRPKDEPFPYCERHGIAVIGRLSFEEGALTGAISIETRFDESDVRFLEQSILRVDRLLVELLPQMRLAELALRVVLQCPVVSTLIQGMRARNNVERNMRLTGQEAISPELLTLAKLQRWGRAPASWSE